MLNLSKIQAITLDLDDTLWPVWPTIARAEVVLHDWLEVHAPKQRNFVLMPRSKSVSAQK
jgi:putative hydrolase of the HAD superfamily